jgi:hypothetical protein
MRNSQRQSQMPSCHSTLSKGPKVLLASLRSHARKGDSIELELQELFDYLEEAGKTLGDIGSSCEELRTLQKVNRIAQAKSTLWFALYALPGLKPTKGELREAYQICQEAGVSILEATGITAEEYTARFLWTKKRPTRKVG